MAVLRMFEAKLDKNVSSAFLKYRNVPNVQFSLCGYSLLHYKTDSSLPSNYLILVVNPSRTGRVCLEADWHRVGTVHFTSRCNQIVEHNVSIGRPSPSALPAG